MRNLVLGSLSVTGLTDINSFSLPVKTLFPSFDDKILNEKEALDPKVISKRIDTPYDKILVITSVWAKHFN